MVRSVARDSARSLRLRISHGTGRGANAAGRRTNRITATLARVFIVDEGRRETGRLVYRLAQRRQSVSRAANRSARQRLSRNCGACQRPRRFPDSLRAGFPARGAAGLLRFVRTGRSVAVVWPQTKFTALPNTPLADAVRLSTADSVVGMAPIVSENAKDSIVVDMSLLLGDVMNLTDTLRTALADPKDPLDAIPSRPNPDVFRQPKAFPKNILIEADETFASLKPPEKVNTVVDPRSLQMRVTVQFHRSAGKRRIHAQAWGRAHWLFRRYAHAVQS